MLSRVTGRQWSMILVVVALLRSASYEFRPPEPSAATELLTGVVPYWLWSALLLAFSLLVVAGLCLTGHHPSRLVRHRGDWVMFSGHLLLVAAYAIYALSFGVGVVWHGEPWHGWGLILLATLMHADRVVTIGSTLGRR